MGGIRSMFKSIFTNQESVNTTPKDIDLKAYCIETLIDMENDFYGIVENQMYATYIYNMDGDESILTEGLKDSLNSFVEFLKKICKKFKEFVAKVFMYIKSYIGNFDKFIEKYSDKLSMAEPDFKIEGFEYTFSNNKPDLKPLTEIVNNYNTEIGEIQDLTNEDIINKKHYYFNIEDLDIVRGKVLGNNNATSSEEFEKIAFAEFRNGDNEKKEIAVNRAVLNKVLSSYKETKKSLKDAIAEKDKTVLLINSMENFFRKSVAVNYSGNTKRVKVNTISVNSKGNGIQTNGTEHHRFDATTVDKYNTYFNYKFSQSKEIGGICITAVTAKIDAIKEAVKFYESIVRKSLFSKKGDN